MTNEGVEIIKVDTFAKKPSPSTPDNTNIYTGWPTPRKNSYIRKQRVPRDKLGLQYFEGCMDDLVNGGKDERILPDVNEIKYQKKHNPLIRK